MVLMELLYTSSRYCGCRKDLALVDALHPADEGACALLGALLLNLHARVLLHEAFLLKD